MKKLILINFLLSLVACSLYAQNDYSYVKFSGKITNKNSDKITIFNRDGFKKEIIVSSNGSFKDTLKIVQAGSYTLFDGIEYAPLFLENGADIYMAIDTKQFDETLTYKGEGSEESVFLAQSSLKTESFMSDDKIIDLSKIEFEKKINSFTTDFETRLREIKDVNKEFYSRQKSSITSLKQMVVMRYNNRQYFKKNLSSGMKAPLFNDFIDFNGGTKSLSDFKGKYVFIYVWATWCGPCKTEIPHYRKLINKYKGINKIVFLGISNDTESSFDTWKNMVSEEKVGGVQLFSKRNVAFVKNYQITGIPRFILIDPNGKIVNAQAPRPSEPKLVELFTSLGIK